MATSRGLSDMFATMSRDLRLKTEGLPDAIFQIFEEEAEVQAEDMRDYIRTRIRPSSSPEGRIRTGDMINSVQARPERHSTQLTVKVGYIGDKPKKDYYFYQDNGFMHTHAGWIEGTAAVADSYIKARERIIARLQSIGIRGKKF